MPISRAQLQKELIPGLNALFGLEYKRYAEEHKEIYTVESSDRSFEEEQKLSGFASARNKDEGQAVEYDTAQEAYTARYVHETVALGFAITEEAVEDNLYDSLSSRYTKALARAMAYTKQVKAANVLNNGFNGAFLGGDNVSLFGTNAASSVVHHPTVSGVTNANRPTVGMDMNETSIEAMAIQVGGWVDERGLLIAAKPKKLIIPRQYEFIAERLLKTALRVGTADNDINAINRMSTIPGGYTVNHFLTDPNAWFVTTDVSNGLKMFQRVAMSTGSDGDFDTGNMRYKARERYCFGWSDPLGIWGSPGST